MLHASLHLKGILTEETTVAVYRVISRMTVNHKEPCEQISALSFVVTSDSIPQ